MADKQDTPLGNVFGVVGFIAGFSIGWQNSDKNFMAALIVGFIVAVLGTFIGNLITRAVIVAAAVAVAIFSGFVQRAVIREVVIPIMTQGTPSTEVPKPAEPEPLPAPHVTEIPGGPPAFWDPNTLKVCNRTDDPVDVAIGYREKEIWLAKGWYRIDPQQCRELISKTAPVIYAYASSAGHGEGNAWVTGKKQARFCINSRDAFEIADGPCEEATNPDYRFQVFGAVIPEASSVCTWELEPSFSRIDCFEPGMS
jgi:uncharacterized membrane protein